LGAYSLESLDRVTQALLASDSQRMLEVVDELERNGQNLQHFSRELARYFRNLLVARIAGPQTRLIAASEAERQKLAATAAAFSEEDLTRYLQLSLDLFRDLQFSLQPRFHLELGLVRLVHAGRLMPLEQALANLETGEPAPQAPRVVSAPKPVAAASPTPPPRNAEPVAAGDERTRLHAHLVQKGLAHLADAVEQSRVVLAGSELRVVTGKSYKLYLEDRQFEQAVNEVFGRPLRIQIAIGEAGAQAPVAAVPAPKEEDAARRALSHPEVRRFQEVLGGEVRKVRNLKE
jgi:DNA polymerase III subunit gamma/tau